MDIKDKYTNRLINEKSPYLLQHAHNPVDWYPWGDEAFEKARKENKPIFLSIGYSTCHWCHVMEEESFSDSGIAEIMNKHFVSIKVDREERPDIDNIYMNAAVALTGSGGWPLNLFLTHGLKPFYAGTYFPPEDKWGATGFKTVLLSIADAWENRKDEVARSSESLAEALQQQVASGKSKRILSASVENEDTLKNAYVQLAQNFDSRFGGFGNAPKFPSGHTLSFLLRHWKRHNDAVSLRMVEKTLSSIFHGGINDHIGGGFHRYSTDAEWRVPHFEKMLYDQAIISRTFLEAYQATGKEEFALEAKNIFEYVLRDMADKEGGFYSAEDADSPEPQNIKEKSSEGKSAPGKKEGAFYAWRKDDVLKILGKETGEIFCYYFGIEEKGNVRQDPLGEFRGKNILCVAHNTDETANHFKKTVKDIEDTIISAKNKVYAARAKRARPHLDDKILVDWNGLMISGLAVGSRVLNEPRYASAAEKSAKFILERLKNKDGRLLHRYRGGESSIPAMIDDYAFFIQGLLDLYEATFKPDYLREAALLAEEMLNFFWDESNGGFFFTAKDAEKMFIRRKEIYDGAIPSGNSVAAIVLLKLGRFTMNNKFEDKAEALFKTFSGDISQAPGAFPQMLIALDFALGPTKEIVITGEENAQDTNLMINRIYKYFIPDKIVIFRPSSEEKAKDITSIVPFLKGLIPIEGKSTAYICENYACNLPVNSIEKMEEILK
ncbi:MAG: thioredoxin domain-containing protein [Candidatus Omnitrophica bacterium]|nr:thioredoxin domain-containing protein [Candidatus Omnitrophota bacterium]